ncbi:hypothetical protein FWK35_00024412 [Aphis craccivora]|uniref:Uncharacterized protein n=1 Tax=Aphis craccivora TaxID=307492 RepID=A0A6G0Y3Y4_APHCR|nr:hypothetical protein FWK35_00024412 [Aphis craccivora]
MIIIQKIITINT